MEIIRQRDDVFSFFKSYAKSFADRMTQRDKRIRKVLLKSLFGEKFRQYPLCDCLA